MKYKTWRDSRGEKAAKQVYLPALDSVRNAKEEIEYAQRRLYHLLVDDGMTVVLTLNQLTDSIAFLCMLRDPKCYESLMELFEMGVLKVSRFGKAPSAAGYVKNHLNDCLSPDDNKKPEFIFSSLPICSTGGTQDNELITSMRDSLDAADPSILRDFLQDRTVLDRDPDAQFLLRYTQMLLRMSMAELAANPRKDEAHPDMVYYLQILMGLHPADAAPYCALAGLTAAQWDAIQEALRDSFRQLQAAGRNLNHRSDWYIHLKAQCDACPANRAVLEWVEGVVDFCYNMCMENSIKNVSTYYQPDDEEMQLRQMFQQLGHYMDPKKNHGHQFLRGDQKEQVWPDHIKLADLTTAVRILKNTKVREREYAGVSVASEQAEYQKKWGLTFAISLAIRLGQLVMSVAIFGFCEYIINWAQDAFSLYSLVATILQLFLFSAFETVFLQFLENKLGVDDLDAFYLFQSIRDWGRDAWNFGYARTKYFSDREQGKYVL